MATKSLSTSSGPSPSGRSQRPAYLMIADTLAARIGRGEYRAGDQLPTEAELRAEFGVSPMTVRRAVNILLDRGIVTTRQGKGTFVRGLELSEAIFRLQPMTEVLDDESIKVALLEARVLPADASTAAALRCAPGSPTILLRRVLERQGIRLMYQLEHVTYDEHRPLVEAQLHVTSLEGLLRSGPSESMPSGRLTIEAVALAEEEAAVLEVPPGSPAFCLYHTFYDFVGQPVSWGKFLFRADKFRLTTQIGAAPPPATEQIAREGGEA